MSHDVLIDVLKPAEMDRVKEPMCPEPDVCVLSILRIFHNCSNTRLQIHILLPPTHEVAHRRGAHATAGGRVGGAASCGVGATVCGRHDDVVVETVWTRCVMPNMGAQKKNQQQQAAAEWKSR